MTRSEINEPAGPTLLRRKSTVSQATANSNGTRHAVLYLRVSTKEQAEAGGEAEGYSIPAQRAACQRKAESLGALVDDEFVDAGESARSADRADLQRLLTYVTEHHVDYVIVHKLDRLARNRLDDALINLHLNNAGATLVSCSENIDETPSGALMHGIMSSIAEFYSKNLSTEAVKGMQQKAAFGGTPGRAPIGYCNVVKLADGREVRTVDVDEVRGPLVTFAFEAYATGEWTILTLLDEVTARGLRTMPGRKRAEKELGTSQLHRLLRNRYYIGKIAWRGVEYDGNHPPLVNPETFTRVQTLLSTKNTAGERQVTHQHYLKGSLFCDACKSRFGFTLAKGHGGVYPYFFCLGRHRRRTDCTQRSLPVDQVEALVEREWQQLRLEPAYAELLQQLLAEEMTDVQRSAERQAAVSKRRLQSLGEERSKLLRAHYDGAIPLDLLRTEMSRLTAEIEGHERRLKASQQSYTDKRELLGRAVHFLSDFTHVYQQAGPQLRRQLNQGMFEAIFLSDGPDGNLVLAEPFRSLLSPDLLASRRSHAHDRSAHPEAWSDGMPAWLRSHPWWTAETRQSREKRSGADLAHSLGLGLNKERLAPPTGFEPVLPP